MVFALFWTQLEKYPETDDSVSSVVSAVYSGINAVVGLYFNLTSLEY